MLEYIKIPKIISNQNYELNKNNYLEYKIISKNKDNVVLINTEEIENKKYWLINEITKQISKDVGESVFIIIDNNTDNGKIEIITGATYNSETLNISFSMNIFNVKEFNTRKHEILLKIKLIQDFYKNYNDVIVYFVQDKDLEIAKQIFPQNNFIANPLKNILTKTKYYQNLKSKISPFVIVFVIVLGLNYGFTLLINNFTANIQKNNINTKNKLYSQLKNEKSRKQKLLNINKSFINIQKKAFLLRNKIYLPLNKEL